MACVFMMFGTVTVTQNLAAASTPSPPGSKSVGSSPEAALPAPDMAERGYIASRIYQAVTIYFAHQEALPGDYDFQAEFKSFLHRAFTAQTRLEFDKAAMQLLGSLRNGHTGFTDQILLSRQSLPFRAARLDGRWFVTRSQLGQGLLDPGDEIITLDGQPIGAWIDANTVFVQSSNQAESEMALFGTSFLWPSHFVLGLKDGRSATIDRSNRSTAPWRGRAVPEAVVVDEPEVGVVQIKIPRFDKPEYESAALEAVKTHRSARTIIFDVRGNGGGDTPQHLMNALIERPYQNMIDSTPLHIGTLDAWAQAGAEAVLPNAMVRTGGDLIQPDHPTFHGKILVLADRYCASACEDFVLGLHESKRATVIGEATYGSTGQPFNVDLPEVGMSFRVSTRREYLPGLRPFEGVGVLPDVSVPLTSAALRSGDDPVLQRAMEIARQG